MRLKPMVGNIHALLGVRPGHLDHQKTISVQYWAEAHFSQRKIRTKKVSNNTALRFIGRCEDLFEVTFGVLPDAIFEHGVLDCRTLPVLNQYVLLAHTSALHYSCVPLSTENCTWSGPAHSSTCKPGQTRVATLRANEWPK